MQSCKNWYMIWFSVLGTNVFTSKCKTNLENIFFIVNRPSKRCVINHHNNITHIKKNLHKISEIAFLRILSMKRKGKHNLKRNSVHSYLMHSVYFFFFLNFRKEEFTSMYMLYINLKNDNSHLNLDDKFDTSDFLSV